MLRYSPHHCTERRVGGTAGRAPRGRRNDRRVRRRTRGHLRARRPIPCRRPVGWGPSTRRGPGPTSLHTTRRRTEAVDSHPLARRLALQSSECLAAVATRCQPPDALVVAASPTTTGGVARASHYSKTIYLGYYIISKRLASVRFARGALRGGGTRQALGRWPGRALGVEPPAAGARHRLRSTGPGRAVAPCRWWCPGGVGPGPVSSGRVLGPDGVPRLVASAAGAGSVAGRRCEEIRL